MDQSLPFHVCLLRALDCIVLNARLVPDPDRNGATDCYAVPLEDIERARELLIANET